MALLSSSATSKPISLSFSLTRPTRFSALAFEMSKAEATYSMLKPLTVRNANAMLDSSGITGWQHRNKSRSDLSPTSSENGMLCSKESVEPVDSETMEVTARRSSCRRRSASNVGHFAAGFQTRLVGRRPSPPSTIFGPNCLNQSSHNAKKEFISSGDG